jgi:mRNA-degrading endonuclease RelE of RelBE toxin-antitoxin system
VSVRRVRLTAQVVEFVRKQAPEPRRRIRTALAELASGRGDVKQLEGPLQAYCRLRVGPFRIIVSYERAKFVDCVFAERRGIVYEVFAETMIERLRAKERPR